MKGMSEAYTKNSRPQGNVAKTLFARIEENVLPHLLIDCNKLFTILEYGAGPGTSSEFVLKPLLQSIHQKQHEQRVMVFFEDLPSNPWGQVFENVPATLSDSGIDMNKLHLAGIGKSFYESLLPPDSVDFVYSSTAMHWLPSEEYNALPVSYRHRQIFATPDLMSDEDHKTATHFARTQWAKCFRHRAEELKSGGYLALAMPADRKNNDDTLAPQFSESFPFDSVPEEFHDRLVSPAWGMSSETVDVFFNSPSQENNELDMSQLFEVVVSEQIAPGCPFTALFGDNLEAKASAVFAALLAVVGPYIRSVLSSKLSSEEIDKVFEEWKNNWESLCNNLEDPSKLKMDVVSHCVILKRK